MSFTARLNLKLALLGLLIGTPSLSAQAPHDFNQVAPATYTAAPHARDSEIQRASATLPPATEAVDPLNQPISLAPRPAAKSEPSSNSTGSTLTTVLGSLAICVGGFLLVVWATRRTMPKGIRPLPSEVLESLGRMPLNPRQQLQLVRLGKKLVLIAVSPHGAESLVEIDDPDEVTRLSGLCQQDKPTSVSQTFREVLGQFGREPAASGFVGDVRESDVQLANRPVVRRASRREYLDD